MDDERFGRELEAARPQMARWAARMGSPGVSVEDVVQNAMIRAWEARASLSGAMAPWLRVIVCRCCVDAIRRGRNAPCSLEGMVIAAPGDFTRDIELRDVARRILSAPHVRASLGLILSGLDSREYAAAVGANPNTIRTRLHRMRKRLIQDGITCE